VSTYEEEDLQRFPIWEHAAEVLKAEGFTYGSTVELSRIAALCKIPEPQKMPGLNGRVFVDKLAQDKYQFKLLEMVSELRGFLLEEHRILLVTDNGGGLRAVLPRDQTAVSMQEMVTNVTKSLRKAKKALDYTNTEMLTDKELQAHSDARSKLDALRIMSRPKLRELSPPDAE